MVSDGFRWFQMVLPKGSLSDPKGSLPSDLIGTIPNQNFYSGIGGFLSRSIIGLVEKGRRGKVEKKFWASA
jgi:hypothetical protein